MANGDRGNRRSGEGLALTFRCERPRPDVMGGSREPVREPKYASRRLGHLFGLGLFSRTHVERRKAEESGGCRSDLSPRCVIVVVCVRTAHNLSNLYPLIRVRSHKPTTEL